MILKKTPEQYIAEKTPDKSLILDRGICFSYEEMKEVPEGRFRVMRNGVTLDSLYLTNPDSDRLLVVLDGSRKRGKVIVSVPKFDMWSWYKKLGMNYLSIEDPMYYAYTDPVLRTGWYYGTKAINYREYVADLIRKICEMKGIPLSKVVIYGLSSGGTAAGFVASLLGDCTALMNNPQINFRDYSHSRDFIDITGEDIIAASENGERNDLVAQLKKPHTCTYFFMFNSLSRLDIKLHLKQVTNAFGAAVDFGLNRLDERVYCFLYLADGAPSTHTTALPASLLHPILKAVCCLETTPFALLQETFSLLHDCCYEYFKIRHDWFIQKKRLAELPAYLSCEDKRFAAVNSLYTTLRLDLKNVGTAQNDLKLLKLSDPSAQAFTPDWFSKGGKGTGHVVLSESGDLTVRLQCVGDGELRLALRGRDVKKPDHIRAELLLDLQQVTVNDNVCIDSRRVVSYDAPFRYSLPVKDGEIVTLQVKWLPHDVRK